MTPREPSDQTRPQPATVVIVGPGGLENGGGIGRQMGYFLAVQESLRRDVVYRVVDTRGPWFLGASPFHTFLSVFYLAYSALQILQIRLRGGACIAHINITGRGSTVRKIILVTIARVVALPYLLHVHDSNYAGEYNRRGTPMQWLIRRMFRGAAKVVVLGTRDQLALSALLRLPPGQTLVLHNAVPDPQPNLPRGRAEGPCHLVFLGYLSERKGVPELLRALASPALMSLPWRATIAGGGPVEEFRRMAADLGVAERVVFPGWIDQTSVKALCGDAEILVLPSHAEGLAMAVLEGLSHGLAVVATPVGAHSEVIEQDVSGLLVPPGDVAALAGALARVIEDTALRDRLRTGARRRFLEKFDVRSYAERLEHLHTSLLSERPCLGEIRREEAS